ncbi:MAG: hypothetical protein ACD_48C00301G0002 [uncultured bacterium]|nr:MAG: hypothetical protein ACD_48C00301G0002 [uncultured bacterium]
MTTAIVIIYQKGKREEPYHKVMVDHQTDPIVLETEKFGRIKVSHNEDPGGRAYAEVNGLVFSAKPDFNYEIQLNTDSYLSIQHERVER